MSVVNKYEHHLNAIVHTTYLGRPVVAAGRSPVVEGRLGAVVEGRRLAAGGTLAAAGDRPLQAAASAFLGPPELPPGQRGGLGSGQEASLGAAVSRSEGLS